MPYKDKRMKRARMKVWREDAMKDGYGKWLYARRKLRFEDADRFRKALEWIIQEPSFDRYGDSAALNMQQIARDALEESRRAEEALGQWEKPEKEIA